jgi:hypothetical protein
MLGGALSLLPVVGPGFVWLGGFFLRGILWVAAVGSQVPLAQAEIAGGNKSIVIGTWLGVGLAIFLLARYRARQFRRLSSAAPRGIISKQISNYTLNV